MGSDIPSRAMPLNQYRHGSQDIRIRLEVAPSSAHEILRLQIYDVISGSVAFFVSSALRAVPMFWVIWLLRGAFGAQLSQTARSRLRADAYLFAILCLLPSMGSLFSAMYSWLVTIIESSAGIQRSDIHRSIEEMISLRIMPQEIGAVATLICGGVFAAIARTALPDRWRGWLRGIFVTAFLAWMGGVLLSLLFAPGRTHSQEFGIVSTEASKFIVALTALILLVLISIRVLKSVSIFLNRKIYWPRYAKLLFVFFAFLAVYPNERDLVESLTSHRDQSILYWVRATLNNFLVQLSSFVPLIFSVLVSCAIITKTLVGRALRDIRLMLFASVLVGTAPVWTVVPVQTLLAIPVLALVVLHPRVWQQTLTRLRGEVLATRRLMLLRAVEHASRSALDGHGEDAGRRTSPPVVPLMVKLPSGVRVPAFALALAFGPTGDTGRDGLAAVRYAVWAAGILIMVYATSVIASVAAQPGIFPVLRVTANLLAIGGGALLASFFLGYFYPAIRGRAGWEKGLWLGGGIALAKAPATLLHAETATAYVAFAVTTIQLLVVLAAVGYIAFDRRTFTEALGGRVEWRVLSRASGLATLGAIATIVLTSIGVATSSALSGQISAVLRTVAEALVPVAASGAAGTGIR